MYLSHFLCEHDVATNMQQLMMTMTLRHLSASKEQTNRQKRNQIRFSKDERVCLRTQPNTVASESIFGQEEYFSIHTILSFHFFETVYLFEFSLFRKPNQFSSFSSSFYKQTHQTWLMMR